MATLDRVLALMSTAFWLGLAQTKGIELILGLIDKSGKADENEVSRW